MGVDQKLIGIIDEPNPKGSQDELGIEHYAKALTEFIIKAPTPLTIGIQGEWGSGKTSILNSIYHGISSENYCKQIWINSWESSLLSSPEEALLKIINEIVDELMDADIEKSKQDKVRNITSSIFKGALRVGASIALGDNASSITDELLGSKGANSIKQLRNQLDSISLEIRNRKTNPYEKIIVYVDDLDRIEPAHAVRILELLKNIFSISGCIFVLAIDYQVVIKGLEHKFGPRTEENEWEFRAFFDKIIQLPFSMPISSYDITKYLKSLLLNINYFDSTALSNEDVLDKLAELVSLTVGTNPRALKRLVNSVSLIEIIRQDKAISLDERIIEFALICMQISYPVIYNLVLQEPNFTLWDKRFVYSFLKNIKIDESDLDILKNSEEFDEEWEQNIWRVCQVNSFLKTRFLLVSKLLNFIKDNLPTIDHEDMEITLERLLRVSSVTSISGDARELSKAKKSNFGKPIREFIQDVYEKLTDTDEVSRDKLRQMIYDEIKKVTNDEVRKNTINCQLMASTVNEPSRRHYGVTDINMETFNYFYYVDENNKSGIMKKFIPQNPPKNIKIYFRKKDTKEDSEITL